QPQAKNASAQAENIMTWTMLAIRAATSLFLKCWAIFLSATISKQMLSNLPGKSLPRFLDLIRSASGPPSLKPMMRLLNCGHATSLLNALHASTKKQTFGLWATQALAALAQNFCMIEVKSMEVAPRPSKILPRKDF